MFLGNIFISHKGNLHKWKAAQSFAQSFSFLLWTQTCAEVMFEVLHLCTALSWRTRECRANVVFSPRCRVEMQRVCILENKFRATQRILRSPESGLTVWMWHVPWSKPLWGKNLYGTQKHLHFLFTLSYPLAFLPFTIDVGKLFWGFIHLACCLSSGRVGWREINTAVDSAVKYLMSELIFGRF